MAKEKDNDSDCCAGLASSQYERGPSDVNSSMNPSEKAVAQAIESRYGKATSPQAGNPTSESGSRFSGPGR